MKSDEIQQLDVRCVRHRVVGELPTGVGPLTNNQVQIEDMLREAGYSQWESFPDVWKLPTGEGAYLTEEALFREWKRALGRAACAEWNHSECFSSLVAVAFGSIGIILLLTALLCIQYA